MEMIQTSNRIHPMMAGAAASVMLVSLLGAAAITGILPSSRGSDAETVRNAAQAAGVEPVAPPAPTPAQQGATAPAVTKEIVEHKTVVHHRYVQHQATAPRARSVQVAQEEPVRHYPSAPAYQQPAPVAQNSPIGIGVGAVVGGLLGSQVGGGNGRTLAAIAGVVGGGYVGNEIAKRNQ
jgi:uncharacterized protein YcfJ